MDRREMLGTLGVAAAGAWALSPTRATAADDPHHHHMDKMHEDCMKACGECFKACNMMIHHCLDKAGEGSGPVKTHLKAASLAMDCQDFCKLSATMMARMSDLMTASCAACAEACKCCAEECEKAPNDMAMKDCAAKCRECEKSCNAMVAHMKQMKTAAG